MVLLVAALVVASLLLTDNPAHAATSFTVNSTADLEDEDSADAQCDTGRVLLESGSECTLRAAIQQANASSGADTIVFGIPGLEGVKTISPTSALPAIIDTLTINGYSQPGSKKNDQALGTNAVLTVELKGSNAGNANGLFFSSNDQSGSAGSVIKGLAINGFQRGGISLAGDSAGSRIEGNFIGTDPSGETDLGNGFSGVSVSDESIVGGSAPEARNLISGNSIHGVGLGGDLGGSKVQGNLIGTDKDGTTPLGNGFDGVAVSGSNNTVGGTEPGAFNISAFNGRSGVSIGFGVDGDDAATGNRVLSNSIFSNAQLGIDLGGLTVNDRKDPDLGNNRRQNHPVLTSAVGSAGTNTVTGKLDSRPSKTFTLQFFSNGPNDPEGKTFLGQKTVKTSRKGKASFTFTATGDLSGQTVTATATNKATGDTSEFSPAVTASSP